MDADKYVPFPTIGLLPPGARRATYVLVGMEPSGGFVESREQLQSRIALGLRNFGDDLPVACLHYAVERWLREPGEGYYLTDIAKCTVPVSVALKTQQTRYSLCSDYLVAEIALLKPLAIIAIGGEAFRHLCSVRRQEWPPIFSIYHYSAQAGANYDRHLTPNWKSGIPSRTKLDTFVESRRIRSVRRGPLHPANTTHRRLLAVYRAQFKVIRKILRDGSFRAGAGTQAAIAVATAPALSRRAQALIAEGKGR